MVATVSFNPVLTSNAGGTFNIASDGYIQGQAMDSPAARFDLVGGIYSVNSTLPLWGGVAISESLASSALTASSPTLGNTLIRATTVTAGAAGTIHGFSVFDQSHHAINSPQSPVPLLGSGMTAQYYRIGSFARIAVACDPSLVSLQNGIITPNVSWDFTNNVLQPYDAATPTYSITSMTWNSTLGGQMVVVAAVATLVGAVGDIVTISGATNTGTGGAAVVNGTFTVVAFTDNQHFTLANAQAAGVVASIGGTILLNAGVGALPVKVLDVAIGNSLNVVYNPTTGFATWNRTGSCALIQI